MKINTKIKLSLNLTKIDWNFHDSSQTIREMNIKKIKIQ